MPKAVTITIALFLLVSGGLASADADAAATPATLVIIDIQEFYFEGGALPLEGSGAAAERAAEVLARFRALGWPVVHVQHLPDGRSEVGQDFPPHTYRIHELVAPRDGELVIGKHHVNAFRETALLEKLRTLGHERLVLVGMQTHMCLEGATRAAADHGFEVLVVHDACATRALRHDGTKVPAAAVHAATLATLESTYARLLGASELLAELPRGSEH